MEMETILLISDESDAEDSSNHRRTLTEERDPLEGRRNLRKKKKVKNYEINFIRLFLLHWISFLRLKTM